MSDSKPPTQELNLKDKMRELAVSVAQECTRYYSPASKNDQSDKTTTNPAVNIICLRAANFRRQNPFGILGIIRLIKLIRRQLKMLNYNRVFVDNATIYLVLALMRMPTNTQS